MFRRTLAAVSTLLFAACAYWSFRIAYADALARDRSLEATSAALRLTPANPDLYLQLAHAYPATPDSNPLIQHTVHTALQLNPDNSGLWIDAAELAEQQRDNLTAEARLLHAVQLDRTFAPRWLLAQYYARRRDTAHFWPAIHAAFATSYDDVTPLFETCWELTNAPENVLTLAIPPNKPDVLQQYLDYLLARKRLDLARPVVQRLLLTASPKTVPSLLTYCDHLLWHNQPVPALEVWNDLAAKRLIPYPSLDSARGPVLINAGFEKPCIQQAFDWRFSPVPGISAVQEEAPPLLRFEFSGKQVEHAELASQFVALAPARSYRLSVTYRVDTAFAGPLAPTAAGADTGLYIHLIGPTATNLNQNFAAGLLTDAPLPDLAPHTAQTQTQSFPFTTPGSRLHNEPLLYRLALTEDRTLGTTRFEGSVQIQRFQLAVTP